jgi:hypothetical protein
VPPIRPAHAGRLPRWERLAFAVVFALMAAFVVAVTISAARAHGQRSGPAARRSADGSAADGSQPIPAGGGTAGTRGAGGTGGAGGTAGTAGTAGAAGHASRAVWDRRLATALAPVLRSHTGNFAVGVINRSTGAMASYGAGRQFHTASIVNVDILATLLLQGQENETGLSGDDEVLATRMIESSDDDAATRLWDLAGVADGVAAADARLGLRHTTPGPGDYWGLTRTTIGDQLRLLRDLTGAKSRLDSGARTYELSLMQNVAADQRWGVSAAASGGVVAVQDGWLPDGPSHLWVVNSVGELEHDGQRLLMVILSDDQPTEAAGIAQDQAAAVAAAACLTSRR